jgi:DNA-binding protein H-NS
MKKVTDVELKQIQDLRESLLVILSTVGELHLTKTVLEKEIQQITERLRGEEQNFADFQDRERVIYATLQEKYGTGNINVDTGEITE